MPRLAAAALVTALAALAACAAPPAPVRPARPPYACLLPNERRMLVAELFFGRDLPGRRPLAEREWARFAAEVITPNFPLGFTVFDGEGQWQNPATGVISRERTKVLLVAVKRSADLAPRLSAVIDGYKARYHQQSVGILTRDACAAF
jgi:hypothetical protein